MSFKLGLDVKFHKGSKYGDEVFRSQTLQYCERQEARLFVDHNWETISWGYDDTFFRCSLCLMETHQRRGTPAKTVEECQAADLDPCTGVSLAYANPATRVCVGGWHLQPVPGEQCPVCQGSGLIP